MSDLCLVGKGDGRVSPVLTVSGALLVPPRERERERVTIVFEVGQESSDLMEPIARINGCQGRIRKRVSSARRIWFVVW